MYDLIVIGGGPAGASAAVAASRDGAKVLLLERARFPRHKVCGEFVSAESLDLLSSLLRSQDLMESAPRVSRARLFIDNQVIQAPVDPPAASISRFDLDASLWRAAEHGGVDTRHQVTALSLAESGPFRVATSAGDFETRAVINATGRWSNLTAALYAMEAKPNSWLGLKAHFAEAEPPASVDLYFFEGGYCGVQPVELATESRGGRINACAMVRSDVASSLPEVFAQHPHLLERSRSWSRLSEPVSTSPLIFRTPQTEKDGVLLVGDAAGFVDPFVGDGISLALRSGVLAAKALSSFLRGRGSLADAAHSYRELYSQQLLPVFRRSSVIRRALLLPRALRAPLLFVLGGNPWVGRYLIRTTR